jgi:hypothetical protein
MSIGASQFKILNPEAENINALISGSNVIALTVSVTDCGLNNFQRSLSRLTAITVDTLNNGEPININSIEAKLGYYYYNVEPFPISTTYSGSACLVATLNPFIETIGFENSDFNILFNNASATRASNYLQDVDRKNDSIIPSNIQNLLDDTAIRANVPDSNYTSLSHTSGRYVGSKTTLKDFGIDPALGVRFTEGASYLNSVDNGYICSQSLVERKIETFLYTGNDDTPESGSRIFTVEVNQPLPVRNRKVWVLANTKVYSTDEEGYTTNSGILCGN